MTEPQAVPKRTGSIIDSFFALRFFTRLRRILRRKAPRESHGAPGKPIDIDTGTVCNCEEDGPEGDHSMKGNPIGGHDLGFDRGGDRWVLVLQKSVKMLHFGKWEEKEAAAREIRKLARSDAKRRKFMVELGVIPPLVAMVGSEVEARRRHAVQALAEIANGSFTNKSLMVEAGVLSKIPHDIRALEETAKQEFAELLLSMSALANSQFSLTSLAGIIPPVVSILESTTNTSTQDLCLSILLNLSLVLDNAGSLAAAGVVEMLIRLTTTKQGSDKALATLGNLVVTLSGRKAIEQNPMVPAGLIEIMTWEESPRCQELSAYILMILAHQSSLQRQKMAEAGIVQVLLEVALLSSPLARKRALKLLQWFKDDRQVRVAPHSGPQVGRRVVIGSPVSKNDANHGKAMMQKIVKLSLYKNMETITRRAIGAEDHSNLKALLISSSSKSLPY